MNKSEKMNRKAYILTGRRETSPERKGKIIADCGKFNKKLTGSQEGNWEMGSLGMKDRKWKEVHSRQKKQMKSPDRGGRGLGLFKANGPGT